MEAEQEKARREQLQKLFGFSSTGADTPLGGGTVGGPWDKFFKKKLDKDDDNDDNDDDDDDDDNSSLKRLLRKELKRFSILKGPSRPAGLKDDDDGDGGDDRDDNNGGGGGRGDDNDDDDEEVEMATNDLLRREPISLETPWELFTTNAYAERATFVDPISGELHQGYDNLGSSALNTMLDTTRNAMVTSSVDRQRAQQENYMKKNNRTLKNKVYKFANKRDERRTQFVNQFGEITDSRATEAEEETIGSVLSAKAHMRSDVENTDLDCDSLTTVYEQAGGGEGGDDDVRKVLVDDGQNGNPEYSDLTADEIIDANLSKKDRLLKGTMPNLLSRSFAVNSDLSSITPLATRINESTKTNREEDRENKLFSNKSTSYRPGDADDPYQQVFTSTDDGGDDDEDDDVAAVAIAPTQILSAAAAAADGFSESSAHLVELREEFQQQYEDRLNTFIGETPLHQDNAVAVNAFLTRTAHQEPLKVEREKVRKREEVKLKVFMRNNYNPNKVRVRDATSYQTTKEMSRQGDLDLDFERQDVRNIDELEDNVTRNSDEQGRADIEEIITNATSTIRNSEESTMGGVLGDANGTKSIGNSFTLEDYLKICGIESMQAFQKLLDEKINPPKDATDSGGVSTSNDSILYDQAKLTFLPNESRPDIEFLNGINILFM